jgi:hypothetical protein
MNNYSAVVWREQATYQWDDDDVCFVLEQHDWLDFHRVSSLKQQSLGVHASLYCMLIDEI